MQSSKRNGANENQKDADNAKHPPGSAGRFGQGRQRRGGPLLLPRRRGFVGLSLAIGLGAAAGDASTLAACS